MTLGSDRGAHDKVASDERAATVRAKPVRHWGQWTAAVIVVALIALLASSVGSNPDLQWGVVGHYFASAPILHGLAVTLELTVISQGIAIVLGFLAAFLGQLRNPLLSAMVAGYVWLFRGVPLLVQLLFWYNLAIVFRTIHVGVPYTDTGWHFETNHVISGFTASILGLALNEGAYMAEIVRGGVLSVPNGQIEAALSLGMRRSQALRKIVMPQMIRVIIPPTGNQFIGLLKASSLVAVIAGGDLLTRAQYIYGSNFAVIPLLIVVSLWYLVLTTIATIGQHYLERALASDSARTPLARRIRHNLLSRDLGARVL
jgi:polar amino acid transport system permease protein